MSMDELASLLEGPRARGALLLRAFFDPPWSIRVRDSAPLTLMTILRGSAWITPDGGVPQQIRVGDLAIAAGPTPYVFCDDPATPVQVVINSGGAGAPPDVRLANPKHPGAMGWSTEAHGCAGARQWGNSVKTSSAPGATTMLVGIFRPATPLGNRLVGSLPPLAVVPRFGHSSGIVALLDEEIDNKGPGHEIVLDRLLDLMLVSALRTWFARPDSGAPRWYLAGTDPVVGPALRMLVEDPARAWTVTSLATATGLSRATLARRFTKIVGEPPMTFLSSWRLAMAADLLATTDATLDTVAEQIGYGSAFALSTAFKRAHGVSPRQHRLAAAAS